MALTWFFFLILVITSTLLNGHSSAAQDDRKIYIVYMGDSTKDEVSMSQLHANMVQKVVGSDIAPGSLLHSYKRSFNGFVAKLTEKEAQQMSGKEGVVSVFPSEKQELHTTRSWDFIGFPQQVKRSTLESDIIIGVIDTGIWPDSASFDDKGLGPPPSKWKGTCKASANFSCNNKIIGAKYYHSDGLFEKGESKSPLDSAGHGTHTASAAAGTLVSDASLYGLGMGTARGGVPSARLAIYKVCWAFGCQDADILAAFDDAIADGVDIISVSLGLPAKDYFQNAIAIGAFHAMRKRILTSTSAGNGGPYLSSLSNFSPWSLSVGASTMDRDFSTSVLLGNNKIYEGVSINTFDLKKKMFPIIYGGDAPNITGSYGSYFSRYCFEDSLDKKLVKGKIVLCDGFGIGPVLAGAVGVVRSGGAFGKFADTYPLPLSSLSLEDSAKVYIYLNSTRKPTASIWKSKEKTDKLAPYIPSYSSRGPNPITPEILKPDLVAPGTYILAAWPPYISASSLEEDKRVVAFNILTGTSMACPHASAAAAYVKSFHPTWSPAAIKSSLMTTAKPMNADLNPEAEFAYGSGLINPLKAAYPGLVYDIDEVDSVIRSLLAIIQWWSFNVTVIVMNKWIFQKLDFKFPLSVSCIHFICSAIGAYLMIKVFKVKPLIVVDPEDRWRRIFPMSFVFCINIVLGNVSLRYIPVSFMQTIKSFTPATTVVLQWLVWRKYFDWRIWTSLIPIVGGILLTSVTELSFNMFGFCAALFGCLATSTKTILAESLLHGYKFDSINTVYYMAPFATMILVVPAMLLEGNGVLEWLNTNQSLASSLIIIFSSGVLAFCLNFSIFYVIHSTTAVTFNVAGNLKVAVAVLVSWMIFHNPISGLNAVGCAVTLVGCTFYGYVRHMLSQQPPGTPRTGTPRTPRTPRNRMELLPLVIDKLDDKV